MSDVERLRQPINAFPSDEDILKRVKEGWKLVAVEWERPATTSTQRTAEALPLKQIEVPFGLKVSNDCRYLEEDPFEMEVLTSSMELMISECPFTRIADELNRKGFRTRSGDDWSPVSIFNMLPRLIEVGPRIFPSEDWAERRKKIYAKVGALL
jgi:hypothetical protein